MSSLAVLFLVALLGWAWQANLKCRDIAVQTGKASCAAQGLQFLDGTVSLRKIRPYYLNIDDFGIQRTYVFDYSADGISRQTGCIVLFNTRLETLVMEGLD